MSSGYSSFTTDLTDRTDQNGFMSYRKKNRSKSLLLSPGLAPLQPDAYAQPCKRASLSDHPHPSGLPIGRRKASNQNCCRWQYKISLQRRLLTVTSDLPGACPMAYCPPGSICGMLSIPRALPSVTHGSALQAPER